MNPHAWLRNGAVAVAVAFSAAALAASYTVTDLGTLGNGSYATGINAGGQVVGNWTASADIFTHGFLYSAGVMMDLGTLPGGGTFAKAVNDKGEVVGSSGRFGLNDPHAFVYSGGTMFDLGSLWGVRSGASGINVKGQVVGVYLDAYSKDLISHAFLYSNGTTTDMGLSSNASSGASGINASGQVIVNAHETGNQGPSHALLYSAGTLTDLGSLGLGTTVGNAINASGQVVGSSGLRAFLYSGGTMTDLGTLAGDSSVGQYSGQGINASGEVVGSALFPAGFLNFSTKVWVYSGGTMRELNSLIIPGSGWKITDATAINDAGQIAATGCGPPGCHALLLSPITNCGFPFGDVIKSPSTPGPTDVIGYRVVMPDHLAAAFTSQTRFFSKATIGAMDQIGTNVAVDVVIGTDATTLPDYEKTGSYTDDFVGHLGPLPAGAYNVRPTVYVDQAGALVSICPASPASTLLDVFAQAGPTKTAPAVEYHWGARDHYFVTQDAVEIQALDNNVFPGWLRTGQSFLAYLPHQSDNRGRPVTRYYGLPSAGLDSHFYSASTAENAAMGRPPFVAAWALEGKNVFEIATPQTLTGECPPGTVTVYRLWNNRPDSNHRYTTDLSIKQQMIARGYVPEGYGPAAVIMCAVNP
ncbi:MAG TPA: hypothetical protein VK639_08785 [Terriglobales bacterium]|nr:hypothetical protein [Terriglobales bacterium]